MIRRFTQIVELLRKNGMAPEFQLRLTSRTKDAPVYSVDLVLPSTIRLITTSDPEDLDTIVDSFQDNGIAGLFELASEEVGKETADTVVETNAKAYWLAIVKPDEWGPYQEAVEALDMVGLNGETADGRSEDEILESAMSAWETLVDKVGDKRALALFWCWEAILPEGVRSDCDPNGESSRVEEGYLITDDGNSVALIDLLDFEPV